MNIRLSHTVYCAILVLTFLGLTNCQPKKTGRFAKSKAPIADVLDDLDNLDDLDVLDDLDNLDDLDVLDARDNLNTPPPPIIRLGIDPVIFQIIGDPGLIGSGALNSMSIDRAFTFQLTYVSATSSICYQPSTATDTTGCFTSSGVRNSANYHLLEGLNDWNKTQTGWISSYGKDTLTPFLGKSYKIFVYNPSFVGDHTQQFYYFGFAASLNSYYSTPNTVSGKVAGRIFKVYMSSDNVIHIEGWACVIGLQSSIGIHVYVGETAGAGGSLAKAAQANLGDNSWYQGSTVATPTCGPTGKPHRFNVKLNRGANIESGDKIYIYGINPNGSNLHLTLSGTYNIPYYPLGTLIGVYGPAVLGVNNINVTISGWACIVGTNRRAEVAPAIFIHKDKNKNAVTAEALAPTIQTSGNNSAGILARCQTSGIGHRFSFVIDYGVLIAAYAQEASYRVVQGLAPQPIEKMPIYVYGAKGDIIKRLSGTATVPPNPN